MDWMLLAVMAPIATSLSCGMYLLGTATAAAALERRLLPVARARGRCRLR
jgi:hypothetical protein